MKYVELVLLCMF